MARPKLTNVEKQWRKKKRAEERAKAKAERDRIKEQLRLRDKRAKAFRKLMPGGLFQFMYCHEHTAIIRLSSSTNMVGYDQLAELAVLFNSTKIHIGVDMEENYDTLADRSYDTGYVSITIENVNWTKLDHV